MREQLDKLHLSPRRLVSGIGSGADGSPCQQHLGLPAGACAADQLRLPQWLVPISAYQTIFALCPGSAEMPSAARPFSAELVARLVAPGVIFAPITLHTGLSSQDAGEAPQPEWFDVSETTAHLVNSSRARGGG